MLYRYQEWNSNLQNPHENLAGAQYLELTGQLGELNQQALGSRERSCLKDPMETIEGHKHYHPLAFAVPIYAQACALVHVNVHTQRHAHLTSYQSKDEMK